ncbi:hypothetical protein [uncultured Brevundimonas sp.]|uniref:hypothetical protein n=1 Tax=uncultured Brevundimonas sp. TaxID=213418 RepID=UPI0026300533|nr:hypothetical protein [uncultured Brevundimonas sp.]
MSLSLEERETLYAAAKIKAARRKRVKAQNTKPSRGRERDNGYLAFLRRQPCAAAHLGGCEGAIEAAHIRYNDGPGRQNPGGARKNHDRHANPLCSAHHRMQHSMSERVFWEGRVGVCAYDNAERLYAEYRSAA